MIIVGHESLAMKKGILHLTPKVLYTFCVRFPQFRVFYPESVNWEMKDAKKTSES
ncbi:hypothetical protein MTBBW1_750036 [Desulfamplus magnetovallimortis]|uniref:Uncharacterized protein n=1 Tax=Desulfamplus magnetovallimortis TaxID=1246637 RepID=A0A1W1HJC9_9BACT|nr:hypothetical protein MTBBW1_750036 [Desulfamplus magnetovallimortis]